MESVIHGSPVFLLCKPNDTWQLIGRRTLKMWLKSKMYYRQYVYSFGFIGMLSCWFIPGVSLVRIQSEPPEKALPVTVRLFVCNFFLQIRWKGRG